MHGTLDHVQIEFVNNPVEFINNLAETLNENTADGFSDELCLTEWDEPLGNYRVDWTEPSCRDLIREGDDSDGMELLSDVQEGI